MKNKIRILGLALYFLLNTSVYTLDVPRMQGRFIDLANVTKPGFRNYTETLLIDHEKKTSNQIAVLIIPNLGGEILEEYSLKVAESWKLGQKGKDNGVLMLIAIEDRKMRIEVGYGLEADLPDVICKRILDHKLKPNFKNQNYEQGIQEGLEAISKAIEKSYSNEEADFYNPNLEYYASSNERQFENLGPLSILDDMPYESDLPWLLKLFITIFFLFVVGIFTYIAAFTPYVGWFIAIFLVPFWAIFPCAVYGKRFGIPIFVTYATTMLIWKIFALITPWGRAKMNQFSPSSGKGSSRTWSSSGSGGFSSSSSSSSGGGGSFGGGGSSSSW